MASRSSRAKISVTADSDFTVQGLSQVMQGTGIELPVLVEFDSGLNRCGVQSPQEAAELAQLQQHGHHSPQDPSTLTACCLHRRY